MADTERIIVVDPGALARQQLVEDMKRLKENPLDVTVPGGYFLVNGKPVDADGNPVKERSAESLRKEIKGLAAEPASGEEPTKAAPKGKGK